MERQMTPAPYTLTQKKVLHEELLKEIDFHKNYCRDPKCSVSILALSYLAKKLEEQLTTEGN